MAVKSIVDIEVRGDQFKAFYELFNKYQKQLEEMPDDWKKVVDTIEDAGTGMEDFSKSSHSSKEFLMIAAIQAEAISKSMQRAIGVQDKFNTKAKDGAIQMTRMQKASAAMHKSISSMSTILLKLGTVGVGGISSAVGAVYGSTSMLAGQNLQARGLGLKIGQTQAFEANFEKFGLSASDLGNIANIQGDPTKWRALIAAGLTPQQIQNEDAEQLTYDFARAAASKYRGWKNSGQPAGSMANAYGFTDFFSIQQLNQMQSRPDHEWIDAQQKELIAAQKAAVDQDTADKASDVKASLKSNWAQVVNTFNDQLAQASPELKKMGDAAAAAAVHLLKVAGPEAKSMLHALEGPPISREQAAKSGTVAGAMARLGYRLRDAAHMFRDKVSSLSGSGINLEGIGSLSGLPTGLLSAQAYTESRLNPKAVSPAGAKGLMQLMDPTARQYGVTDPFDPLQSAMGGARYDAFLLKRYGGDVRKALAAYNWGMGNKDHPRLDAAIAAHGSDWERYAPRETQTYIAKILSLMSQRQGVNINITNSTAARVAVSTNAAPH
jgi:soluble lytic murein transglycosylase-like protein